MGVSRVFLKRSGNATLKSIDDKTLTEKSLKKGRNF